MAVELPSESDLALLDGLFVGAASETLRRMMMLVLVGAPRIDGLSVAPWRRNKNWTVLRIWRGKVACFDVSKRETGLTWFFKEDELQRERIDIDAVIKIFPGAKDRACDREFNVWLDSVDDVRRMLSFIEARG